MTDTAQKIMAYFEGHAMVKSGMVISFSELSCHAKSWGQQHADRLRSAIEELRDEGYVIITPLKVSNLRIEATFIFLTKCRDPKIQGCRHTVLKHVPIAD